ncbi:Golgi apparatus membrane TVP [Olea europaea subsp. europaea]|uniref:Golgi apparatus membrane TVP n=1 Tax=Olea europaea subsp. europaea TaxID=158383 RepID=A0A8S0RJZ4_OLEEU|nr:Golgi apparatus membrane TVP [Olea europaea subsp. europaea]
MEGESSQPLHRGVDNTGSGPSASSIRLRSRPDPFLILWRCFSVITSLAAILCIAVNVLSAVRSFKNGSDIFDGIFRCYAVVIAMFVVVAETEWGFIIKFWKCAGQNEDQAISRLAAPAFFTPLPSSNLLDLLDAKVEGGYPFAKKY